MNSTTLTHPPVSDLKRAAASTPHLAFWGGALAAVAVIALFYFQVAWALLLVTPWYVPIVGSLGALSVGYSLTQRRNWWRIAVALFCAALACLEWHFVVAGSALPAYAGPVAAGVAVPPFRANLADGSPIDESYLRENHATAVVFFQGRWCPFCVTQLRELEANHAAFDRVAAKVVVVSIEDLEAAAETQRDFPHLVVVSDEQRELSNAMQLINEGMHPDGGDSAAPTILLVDQLGIVRLLHRPTSFIARPSTSELVSTIENMIPR